MRIKKSQLRRLIREAIDPREMEEPLGGWAGNALTRDPELAPRSPEEHAREKFKVGDLVRSVDYRGDGWGGDFERVLGNFPGTIVDIDDDLDGTQYVVNWPAGEPTMVTAGELELVTEGNSTDPSWPRQAQSKLRYALVDYIDAYTLKAGLNPGNRRDSQRIHSEIDSIVDSILGN